VLNRHKRFLIFYVVCFLAAAGFVMTSNEVRIALMKFIPQEKELSSSIAQYYLPMRIVSNIDDTSHVIMKIYISCQSATHKMQLKRQVPKIKNDILQRFSEKMAGLIENREYGTFKTCILDIINKYSSITVSNIYFDEIVISS